MVSQLRFVVHEEEIDRCILSVAGDGKPGGLEKLPSRHGHVECCKKKHGQNLARFDTNLPWRNGKNKSVTQKIDETSEEQELMGEC